MAFPDVTFRTELPPTTRKELDHLCSQVQGFLTEAGFREDGSFIEVRADLVTATEVVAETITAETITGDGVATMNAPPAGTILAFGASSAPTGYLACDGSAVSRTTYARLFGVIATTWGAGNGSTTFNVPDLRGLFLIGTGGTAGLALAATGGTWNHTHTIGSDGSHDHGGATGAGGAHEHTLAARSELYTDGGTYAPAAPGTSDDPGTHTHTISSGGAHTHSGATGTANPPYAAVTYIVKY